MSEADKTNTRNPEEKGFVKEEYAPAKRFPKGRKFLRNAGTVLLLAVLFGVIARISYWASDRFLNRLDDSRTSVSVAPESGNGSAISDSGSHAEFDSSKLAAYDQLLSGVRSAAEALSGCVCTVLTGQTLKDDVFDSESVTYEEHCGIVIADNGVEFLVGMSLSELGEPDDLQITFENGTTAEAELLGKDAELDLAILSVDYRELSDRERDGILTVSVGDGSTLAAGSMVVAIGAPDGVIRSVDFGMVSSVEEAFSIIDGAVGLVRTNMRGTGESSGILVNAAGQLVGIISREKSAEEGILVAFPVSDIEERLSALLNGRTRIVFGVYVENLSAAEAETLGIEGGVLVTEVTEDSPAYENEFRKGDILLSLAGNEITDTGSFGKLLQGFVDGQRVEIRYLRNGKEMTKNVTMREE